MFIIGELQGNKEMKWLEAIVDSTINENVTSLAGVPSWMLVLLNSVLDTTGKENLFEVWPNLEVYFHGGVSFEPYLEQYNKIFPRENFRYYEIYNASEGFLLFRTEMPTKNYCSCWTMGSFTNLSLWTLTVLLQKK